VTDVNEVDKFAEGPEDNSPERFLTLSVDEFARFSAKKQNLVLFVLLRDLAGEARAQYDRIDAITDDIATAKETIRQVIEKFNGGFLGSMMGGF